VKLQQGISIEKAREIVKAIKDGIGVTVEVVIVDPDTLERSAGKLQRVKDLRSLT